MLTRRSFGRATLLWLDLLERRQKRLGNEQKRTVLQQQDVAAQQAKLVELQATADGTASEVAALQRKYAATSEQIAILGCVRLDTILATKNQAGHVVVDTKPSKSLY